MPRLLKAFDQKTRQSRSQRWRLRLLVFAYFTATGLLLLKLFGRRGPIGAFLFQTFHIDVVFTWRAVVIAAAVMSFPLLVRAARVGFESVDIHLEEIAVTMGASTLRIFFTVTLPLAARAISAGIILAFARAVGEFGATILLAGNIPGRTTTMSLKIYEAVQLGQDAIAYRLVIICLLISFLAIWLSARWSRSIAS